MKNNALRTGDVVRFSWGVYKKFAWFVVCFFVASMALTLLASMSSFADAIVSFVLGLVTISIGLSLARSHMPTWSSAFSAFRTYHVPLRFIGASIIFGVIVIGGLLLLIVPGIYAMLRLQFYKYILLDNPHAGVMQSLRESWNMTDGHTWDLFTLLLVAIVGNILGLFAFGVGLIITIPVTVIGFSHVYFVLAKKEHVHEHTHTHAIAA